MKKLTLGKIILITVFGVIILGIIITILTFTLKFRIKLEKSEIKLPYEKGEKLENKYQKDVLIYDINGYEMYFDFYTTNIKIKKNGEEFNTIPDYLRKKDPDKLDETKISPLNISYIYKGTTTEQRLIFPFVKDGEDFYYTAEKLKNGIRINYEMLKRNIDPSWIPQKIRREEYQKLLEDAKDDKKLRRSLMKSYDYLNYKNDEKIINLKNPDANDLKLIYEMWTKKYNLTAKDLIKRAKDLNYKSGNIDRPHFIIPVEYRLLDKGDLLVEVLTDKIQELSDDLGDMTRKLSKIELLPNFLSIKKSDTKFDDKGKYFFIPDGSGALCELDKVSVSKTYQKSFFDNDSLLSKNINKKDLLEKILIPNYAMVNNKKGIMANIITGAGNGKLLLANYEKEIVAKTVFDIRLWDTYEFVKGVKITSYEDSHPNDRIKIKYNLIKKDSNITYYDLVKITQESYFNITKKVEKVKNIMLLEILGAFKETKHFLGIPYEKTRALTSYDDFISILEELKDYKIDYKYLGFSNGGILGNSQLKLKRDKSLGKNNILEDLIKSDNIYFDIYLVNHYKDLDGNFKNSKHGIKTIGGSPATFYTKNRMTMLGSSEDSLKYYLLNPNFLLSQGDIFLKNNSNYKNLSLRDIGNTYLANYTAKPISGSLSLKYQEDLVKKFSNEKSLMLNKPFMPFAKYANIIEDIPNTSSKHLLFTQDIPFYGLVLEPFCNIYLKTINLDNKEIPEKTLLNALMMNAKIKMTLSKSESLYTKDELYYNKYYATSFTDNKNFLDITYNKLLDFEKEKDFSKIKDHKLIEKDIFKVDYMSGKSFIFNMSNDEVVYNGIKVEKLSYKEI